MKKALTKLIITILCLSCFPFCFVACNNIALYNNGLKVVSLLNDMITDDVFVKDFASVSETELQLIYANDYDSPIHVFEISEPSFDAYIATLNNSDTFKEQFNLLSPANQEYCSSLIDMRYIVSTINCSSQLHYQTIRLASTFIRTKDFSIHINKSISYLYTFETGKPVLVYFEKLSPSKVRATGYFLFVDDEMTFDNVKKYFSPYGCEVTEVR